MVVLPRHVGVSLRYFCNLPSGRIKLALAISPFCCSLIAVFSIASRSTMIITTHGPDGLLASRLCAMYLLSRLSSCRSVARRFRPSFCLHANSRLLIRVTIFFTTCTIINTALFQVCIKSFISFFLSLRFKYHNCNLEGYVKCLR